MCLVAERKLTITMWLHCNLGFSQKTRSSDNKGSVKWKKRKDKEKMALQGAETPQALSVSFVMLVTVAAWFLQQKAAQMISNPWNPTEEWGGQLVRNPVLLIREECSAFHLDAGSVTVLSASEDWGDDFLCAGHSCAGFKTFWKVLLYKNVYITLMGQTTSYTRLCESSS